MALFFYDGPISRAVAFEGLLNKGEYFASRLVEAFSEARDWPQLVHIATDGETYGHHHKHGEMALSYAIEYIESTKIAKMTNYGEFLERHPPIREVRIKENTSWSCVHGIERWRADCGCNSGSHPDWNQQWRSPLRESLEWLRDRLATHYQQKAREFFRDPWTARNNYIGVILDRSLDSIGSFLAAECPRPLDDADRITALKLLEMQRHTLLMFTSCGWFFDEISGIETVQVIQYAGRALQLSQQLFGDGLESQFLEKLAQAKSNLQLRPNGNVIFKDFVKPATVNLESVAAHYAISSLFESYPSESTIYCFGVSRSDYRLLSAGKMRLAIGRTHVRSGIVLESEHVTFGMLHMGDHNVSGGVRKFQGEQSYETLCSEIAEVFERGDLPEILRIVDRRFGSGSFTLRLLFRDEQRRILRLILNQALEEAETSYRQLFEHYAPMMRFMADLHIPPPRRFQIAAEFTLNSRLRRELEADAIDLDRVYALLDETKRTGISLDSQTLEFAMRAATEHLAQRWFGDPDNVELLRGLTDAAGLAAAFPFPVDLSQAQNIFFKLLQDVYPDYSARSAEENLEAKTWISAFLNLGDRLRVRIG
jgi:hypothetical protein